MIIRNRKLPFDVLLLGNNSLLGEHLTFEIKDFLSLFCKINKEYNLVGVVLTHDLVVLHIDILGRGNPLGLQLVFKLSNNLIFFISQL